MRKFLPLALIGALLLPAIALSLVPAAPLPFPQENTAAPKVKLKYPTGRKIDPVKVAQSRQASVKKYGAHLKALPVATEATFDWRAKGVVPPIGNQKDCGSCWAFSAKDVLTCALIQAGYGKNDGSFYVSVQYILDCQSNGGCNGDDNINPVDQCLKVGIPTEADYGVPYQGRPGSCKNGIYKKLKIAAWGFCTTSDQYGLARTQDIKNAMKQYGPIGCAVAAGGTNFWNTGQGVNTGRSSQIDHDVIIVGWDDTKDCGDGSKGAWIMRNSWDVTWGVKCENAVHPAPVEAGYAWMKYGADLIGTEAVWVSATPIGPTPPNPPVPPAPVVDNKKIVLDELTKLAASHRGYLDQYAISRVRGMVNSDMRAIPYLQILQEVLQLVQKYGPLAAPIIDDLIERSSLSAAQKAALEALVDAVLGRKAG